MTTTLRPTEPLQRGAGGALSRHYRVCVNSRPVGEVRLSTHPFFGPSAAVIRDLRIEEADRGRGRGAVAALAAEEVARGWGCKWIDIEVPADAQGALRLATALGYVHRNRRRAKPLGQIPPGLPAGSRVRPMSEDEFGRWLAAGTVAYARDWSDRGVPAAQARAKSEHDFAVGLPQGLSTPGTRISVLEQEGTRVGTLWLVVGREPAFVCDVLVDEGRRGQGHGRTLMLLAEAQAIGARKQALGLSVFAGNTPAERLYDSLGYVAVAYCMYKTLS